MDKKRKYITHDRIKRLEDSISFISNYEMPEDEYHFIGVNINTENVKLTKALQEISRINKRKKELLSILLDKNV